jgi:hypothetical protein
LPSIRSKTVHALYIFAFIPSASYRDPGRDSAIHDDGAADMMEKALPKKEAAERLGVSPKSLADARLRRRVGLRAVRIGRSLRFLESELDRVLACGLENGLPHDH